MQHWGGLSAEIKLSMEGLPVGWTCSVSSLSSSYYRQFVPPYGYQALLTITPPKDAKPGTVVPFRVVGRAEQDGVVLERTAQPLTLLGSSHNDRMHLRFGFE